MKIQLHKPHILTLVSFIFVLALLYVGSYYLYLKPLKEQIQQVHSHVSLLEKQINKAESPTVDNAPVNTFLLQQSVPVSPLVDQLVLDLEKAEIASNSTIQTIEFSEGTPVVPVTTSEENTNAQTLPEGLEQLSIGVTVTSKNFTGLKKFVDTIEQQTRVTMVKQISFQGPPESSQQNQEVKEITYQLQLNVYYLPTLSELAEVGPTLQAPPPSEKSNPLTLQE